MRPPRPILPHAAIACLALWCAAAALPAGAQSGATAPAPLPGRPAVQAESPATGEAARAAGLAAIYAREEALWLRAARHGSEHDDALQEDFHDLTRLYDAHLLAFPKDLESRLLYGKLLRRLGQVERAHEVFVEADRIDPNVAVVKQQLGNFLAETGEAQAAVRLFLRAIELDPEVALYHNQLGELLHHFRDTLLRTGQFSRDLLDRQMLEAFGSAVRLAPEQMAFRLRWAEAHYDVRKPDWPAALAAFDGAMVYARSEAERQAIILHRARCLKELGRLDEARALAESVDDPRLQTSRSLILRGL